MLFSEYEAIIRRHCSVRPLRCSLDVLIREFPHVPAHVLRSIISTHFTMAVRKNYDLYSSPENVSRYYGKYKQQRASGAKPGFLVDIADELNLSPALMCRFVVENYLREIGEVNVKKRNLNRLLRDSSHIADEVLAVEVFLCSLHDPFYGPSSDAKRSTVGQEFELVLKDALRARGIGFVDETVLRERGYDKTPDIKLDVPAIINGEYVITWIESKASFGDPKSHETYTREQFHSYTNRFGPGLVIYWCGFVDELQESQPERQQHQEQDSEFLEGLSDSSQGDDSSSSSGSDASIDEQPNGSIRFFLSDRFPDDIRSMTDCI